MLRLPRLSELSDERLEEVRSLIFHKGFTQGRTCRLTVQAIYSRGGLGILGCWNLPSAWTHEERLFAVEPQRGKGPFSSWDLANGEYLVQFNETLVLTDNELAILRPLDRLMASGATHPILCLDELSRGLLIPLLVSQPGIRIYRNARISAVTIMPVRIRQTARVSHWTQIETV